MSSISCKNEDISPFAFNRIKFYLEQSDKRGSFKGIVNNGEWQEVNIIHTKASQVRGGHFHRHTTEVIFMLSGRASVKLNACDAPQEMIHISLAAGEGIVIHPSTAHVFTYEEDSVHLQLLDRRFNPNNEDLIPA